MSSCLPTCFASRNNKIPDLGAFEIQLIPWYSVEIIKNIWGNWINLFDTSFKLKRITWDTINKYN